MISLVLGLGNIGRRYEKTRHNLGFRVLDLVCEKLEAHRKPAVSDYDWAEKTLNQRRIILARPKTYMNLSGLAARALLRLNHLEPEEMLVVVDDFNLPLGRLRFRPTGSDGGHNGLESIIGELQTENFPRLRLGIGPVTGNRDAVDFVLGKFTAEEADSVKKMIASAAEAVIFALHNRFEEAMSKYNNPALPL
ncbi:MAG: aminoacyl-tRNA hydrolase [candidate division Zixibacteria bacterium]|nr:aminoacyl-tRNA hydrolase [candidate division Zixibacteria bacterium]